MGKLKKKICVSRESNPDQLLGRQLCWLLTIIPPMLFCLIVIKEKNIINWQRIWKFYQVSCIWSSTNPCCRYPFLREKLAFVSFFFAVWNSVYSVHKSPFNILNFRLGTLKIVKYNFYHISKWRLMVFYLITSVTK